MKIGELLESRADIYEIVEERGAGGFAQLWVARRSSDGQAVVIKELRLDKLGDWKALELFEREAKALKGLSHPKIPDYVEFFARTDDAVVDPRKLSEHDGARLYLVQELVSGQDLNERLKSGPPMDKAEVVDVLRQILDVLGYLHALNPPMIHRDIHPRNIIVSDDGVAHLIDFGAIQDQMRFGDEFGSTSVGTFGFIPLEQSMGQARPASDLYALGMTILTVMTGRNPSEMPLDEATGAVDLAALNVSPELRPALQGMTQPIAGQRFQSAAEAIAALDKPQTAMEPAKRNVPAVVPTPLAIRILFHAAFWPSLVSAVYIYVFAFDSFSETELVQVSAMWLLPMVFGGTGFFVTGSKNPFAKAVLTTILAAAGMVVFFGAIFPAL
ncbi:MAG: serine/threonine-protein kinase [bacterium]